MSKDIPDIDIDISELSHLLNLGSPNKILLLKLEDNCVGAVIKKMDIGLP